MATRQHRRSWLPRLILPAIAAAYLGYFGFWAFHGHYGIWAKARLEADAQQLDTELASLSAQRTALERRVMLLRPQSVDQDMLDELVRQALNLLQPNDVVIDTALQQRNR